MIFQMAKVAMPQMLFRVIIDRIRRLRFAKIVGKSAFATYLLYFVGVCCEKTHRFRRNNVDNEMILHYYKTLSLQEWLSEVYMGNHR